MAGGYRFASLKPGKREFGINHGPLCWSNGYPPWGVSTTFTVNEWSLKDFPGKIPRIEFYFDWDRNEKLLKYRIHNAGAPWWKERESSTWHLFYVERDTFYAQLGNTLRKIGCPSFLPGETEIIEWFVTADCIDFKGYVALSMYKALRNALRAERTGHE